MDLSVGPYAMDASSSDLGFFLFLGRIWWPQLHLRPTRTSIQVQKPLSCLVACVRPHMLSHVVVPRLRPQTKAVALQLQYVGFQAVPSGYLIISVWCVWKIRNDPSRTRCVLFQLCVVCPGILQGNARRQAVGTN